ncbi:MAG: dipeptidase [Halioglobus sp.]
MMKRLSFVFLMTCLAGCAMDEASLDTVGSTLSSADVEALHQSLLTIDSHIDIPISLGMPGADPALKGPMQVDFPSMREGGLDAGFFIVYVAQGAVSDKGYQQAYDKAQAKFAAIERMLANSPDEILLATTVDELLDAQRQGKLVAAIGVENAYSLGKNFEHLDEFYNRGARYVSFTHFGHNQFGDSSSAKGEIDGHPEPVSEGLSERGRELLSALNQRGIMVDVSHTSRQTTLEAATRSSAPIIASHSGVLALHGHSRNLSDEEILAIAANDGVIQVVAFDKYMRDIPALEKAAMFIVMLKNGLMPESFATATQAELGDFRNDVVWLHQYFPKATVSTLVDHIDYIVQLAGIDHVGIASDFGGGGGVYGWYDIDQTVAVTRELLERGYSRDQIEKIWGGNLLRVWRAVEATAGAGI